MNPRHLCRSTRWSANIGDVGHEGHSHAATMPDGAELCGCTGVNKGAICKAIKEKGLFTLEGLRVYTAFTARHRTFRP